MGELGLTVNEVVGQVVYSEQWLISIHHVCLGFRLSSSILLFNI